MDATYPRIADIAIPGFTVERDAWPDVMRGTIRGRVVARTFVAWLDALDWHFLERGAQTDSTED